MLDGRLTINIISSDLPGAQLASEPRYARTLEVMTILRALLAGEPIDHHGELYDLTMEAPRIAGRPSCRTCEPPDSRRRRLSTSGACPSRPARSPPRPPTST
jgi:alkanesulfonate monooxygenase SsuD/methylene tetrahydromethanopterin reductase-like flavin-dependent oxidoreductase (luciferase family)